MTPKTNEIKEILIFWLLPWPTRKQNIRMWSIVAGSWFLAWWAFGLCWVLVTGPAASEKTAFGWLVLLVMTFYTCLAVLGDQMLRGAKARAVFRQAAINDAMKVVVETLMKHNADGLKKMVGRDVNQNPISMTAATLEAGERLSQAPTPKNPLQAALQGDEEAFDEMLDDEDDEKPF